MQPPQTPPLGLPYKTGGRWRLSGAGRPHTAPGPGKGTVSVAAGRTWSSIAGVRPRPGRPRSAIGPRSAAADRSSDNVRQQRSAVAAAQRRAALKGGQSHETDQPPPPPPPGLRRRRRAHAAAAWRRLDLVRVGEGGDGEEAEERDQARDLRPAALLGQLSGEPSPNLRIDPRLRPPPLGNCSLLESFKDGAQGARWHSRVRVWVAVLARLDSRDSLSVFLDT
jgi:hypothetical protein